MRLLMTAGSDFEAEIVCNRLLQAGIEAMRPGDDAHGRSRGVFVLDIYVAAEDLARARAVLDEAQDVSEEELIRLSEAVDDGATETTDEERTGD
jgi:hypothetical protein